MLSLLSGLLQETLWMRQVQYYKEASLAKHCILIKSLQLLPHIRVEFPLAALCTELIIYCKGFLLKILCFLMISGRLEVNNLLKFA